MPEVHELAIYRVDGKGRGLFKSLDVLEEVKKDSRNHRQRYRAERLAEYRSRSTRVRWALI